MLESQIVFLMYNYGSGVKIGLPTGLLSPLSHKFLPVIMDLYFFVQPAMFSSLRRHLFQHMFTASESVLTVVALRCARQHCFLSISEY